MHYALAAAFAGDPAFRASTAYGANGVGHDLIPRLAVERWVELIVAEAGDDGQRRVQHVLHFAAGPRPGQVNSKRRYGFAFLAAKLVGDPDENFPMMARDCSGPRIWRLKRLAFRPNLPWLRIGAQSLLEAAGKVVLDVVVHRVRSDL
jgi:hypothetical protein